MEKASSLQRASADWLTAPEAVSGRRRSGRPPMLPVIGQRWGGCRLRVAAPAASGQHAFRPTNTWWWSARQPLLLLPPLGSPPGLPALYTPVAGCDDINQSSHQAFTLVFFLRWLSQNSSVVFSHFTVFARLVNLFWRPLQLAVAPSPWGLVSPSSWGQISCCGEERRGQGWKRWGGVGCYLDHGK